VTDSPDVDQELTAELADGVLTLTINRADSSNAIPYYVRDRLIQHFQDAHSDLEVRCIVLTGAGERHFGTGSDLWIRPPMPE
jgi:enoyl-CoA hydratase/carnithine racemase